jgi:cyclase
MTAAFRIIPRLDIKGPNLVKGMHLEGLRVLGKPEDFAKFYYENGADELIYQDVVASLYGRNSLHEVISKTAEKIFIPLTVGGGIKTVEDISNILRSGADKVCINTAAIKDPSLISKAAKVFGVSTIVIGIEAILQENGEYIAFVDNGRNSTEKNAVSWAKEAQDLGAGELLITCVDKEGTGKGYDSSLLKQVLQEVSIPVVVHGGIGKKEDVLEMRKGSEFSGVAISSILHYDFIKHQRNLEGYEDEGNTEFLKSYRSMDNLKTSSIKDIKALLSSNGIISRPVNE